jgi:hypothetical protein
MDSAATVHFTSPVTPGAAPCGSRLATILSEDPTVVTCESCQFSEDFLAALDYLEVRESTPEARRPGTDTITVMRQALAAHTMPKVDGHLIDIQSVNAIVTVYDWLARDPKRQAAFAALPVVAMAHRAWEIVGIAQRKAAQQRRSDS